MKSWQIKLIYTLAVVLSSVPLQAAEMKAPITWCRSSEDHVLGVTEKSWAWSTASSIQTELTQQKEIWDGPYEPYYKDYIGDPAVHSSATWQTQNEVDLRRFKGKFQIPEGYCTEDFVCMKSIVQSQYSHLNKGNIIPINDNIYVFVYPESLEGKLSDKAQSPYYFMNYLAFWTGTANRIEYGIQEFYGKAGTYAYRNTEEGPIVTDGWYAEATIDNIGTIMHETTKGAGEGTPFIVDVYTEDNSPGGGGGMDELILEFKKNPRGVIEVHDDTYAIPASQTTLVQIKDGLLENDGPQGTLIDKIKPGQVDGYTIKPIGENLYEIYKDAQSIAKLTYIDEKGEFEIKPNQDFVGEIEFCYEVWDKLGKHAEAMAHLYVMPYVEINHRDMMTGQNLRVTQKVYGNPYGKLPEDTHWMISEGDLKENKWFNAASELLQDYHFVEGKLSEADVLKTSFKEVPYEYNFQLANESLTLDYRKNRAYLFIDHEYLEESEKSYKQEIEVLDGEEISVGQYVDLTADSFNHAYQLKEISLQIKESSRGLSEQGLITIDEPFQIIGGYTYEIIVSYEKEGMAESPSIPEEPGMEESPIIPEEPGMEESPSVPEEPGMEESPSIPEEPGVEESPSMPEEPGVEESPSMPEEPGMEESPSYPGTDQSIQTDGESGDEDLQWPQDEVEILDEEIPGSPIIEELEPGEGMEQELRFDKVLGQSQQMIASLEKKAEDVFKVEVAQGEVYGGEVIEENPKTGDFEIIKSIMALVVAIAAFFMTIKGLLSKNK